MTQAMSTQATVQPPRPQPLSREETGQHAPTLLDQIIEAGQPRFACHLGGCISLHFVALGVGVVQRCNEMPVELRRQDG